MHIGGRVRVDQLAEEVSIVAVIQSLVYEHALLILQRRLHTLTLDPVRGYQGADNEKDKQRYRDHLRQVSH